MVSSQKRAVRKYRERLGREADVSRTIAGEPLSKGGILAALRRSPLVGADLDLVRAREEGSDVDL